MSSYLDFEGVYDPKRMYAVTNWSDEAFSIGWNDDAGGETIYTLLPGDVKVYPQYLAYHITRNFVDREMFKEAAKAAKNPDGSPSRQQERLEMAVANKDSRKPYEDKTIQEVIEGQESPEVTAMRAKIRKEIEAERGGMSNEMHQVAPKEVVPEVSEPAEFPDVPVSEPADVPVVEEAAPGEAPAA